MRVLTELMSETGYAETKELQELARQDCAQERCLVDLPSSRERERELIQARTNEGRIRAIARGVRLGRKPKLTRLQIAEALARREAGEALAEIGRSYNVTHSTISRLAG
jgi:hypothetical protein